MSKALLILGAPLLGLVALSWQDAKNVKPADRATKAEAEVVRVQKPSYPLDTCPISGKKLGAMGDPIDLVHEGRLVRLCCKGCIKTLEKDAKDAFAKIDAAVVKQQKPSYPLDVCPISGEKLADEEEPVDLVHGTRLVRLCCKGCVKKFKKDPAESMAKIDAALIAAQIGTYPLDTCLISDEPLDIEGEPLNVLHGTTLVRFCCKGCKKPFRKDPGKFLAKLAEARKKKAAGKK